MGTLLDEEEVVRLEHHDDAGDLLDAVLAGVSGADAELPTPCEGWTVADLLAHQVGQETGWSSAFAGGGRHLDDWRPVAAAPIPRRAAVAARRLDLAVHAWDLAVAVGVTFRVDPALAAAVLRGAEAVPVEGRGTGASFGPVMAPSPSPLGLYPFDRALLLLGRDPGWFPPGC